MLDVKKGKKGALLHAETAKKRVRAVVNGGGGGAFSTHIGSNISAAPTRPGYAPPPTDSPRWALV